jgi:pimeloyl-ACP methyl ester carboxylesterase
VNETVQSVRGGRFRIVVGEAGTGFPTVYLHGELLPPAPPEWLDELTTTRRVIAPQHPGFGRSTGLEHLDDVLDLTICYLDLFDALGLNQIDLIGESFGGMLAAELAALAPDRIRRLALVAPLGFWLDESPTLDVFALPARDVHRQAWSAPEAPPGSSYAPGTGTDEEKRRAHVERVRSLAAAGKFIFPIPDKGLAKRIHRIAAPTLLLWGAEDRIVPPAYAAPFQERIRDARLVSIVGAGHFPLLERPTEALGTLQSFLDR